MSASSVVVVSSLFQDPTNPTLALVSRITKPIFDVEFPD
jgi:hypothetical protein